MPPIVFQILLGLVVIATLVLAYLASKRWHWGQVVVVVLLVFCSIGYAILAANIFSERSASQARAERAAKDLAETNTLLLALDTGSKDPGVIAQLGARELRVAEDAETLDSAVDKRHLLELKTRLRGRSWSGGAPTVDRAQGKIAVRFADQANLGISPGSVLFAFEEGDPGKGAEYIGEFRAINAAQGVVTLEPVVPPEAQPEAERDKRELARIMRGRGPWVLYESMPVDTHDVFEGVPPEQLKTWFSEPVAEEYIRDGGELTNDDPPQRREGFNADGQPVGPDDYNADTVYRYSRQLRDYAYLFHQAQAHKIEMLAALDAAQTDGDRLQVALASAKQSVTYRTAEVAKLTKELTGLKTDLKALTNFYTQVQQQLTNAKALFEKTLVENNRLAEQLFASHAAALGGDLRRVPAPSRGAVDIDAL
ncbi:hypothetical protein Pla175_04650 [Pirellulimonas nuda]|uniref:Uncharacterized protein n=1 Tax=Pirellulimonas nuda TaxID=2528009 RepID=A0A518D6J9_9BACT|nr:hypothetical protein [Pirellulimonas nuda]QDU87110.1 hypothetical protein Pla175_04650 [Pirellulimonas nuda]